MSGHDLIQEEDNAATQEAIANAVAGAREALDFEIGRNSKLAKALAWYADINNHIARYVKDETAEEGRRSVWPILTDKGKVAREALGLPEPESLY